MKLTPVTEQELQEMGLIKPGVYAYEVVDAVNWISKNSGNEMIKLQLKVWDEAGHERLLYDFLLDSMPHKLKHFCDHNGLQDKYQSGNLEDKHCLGKAGKCQIVIQKGKENPLEGGFYPDRNSIKDYVDKGTPLREARKEKKKVEDDDIPF